MKLFVVFLCLGVLARGAEIKLAQLNLGDLLGIPGLELPSIALPGGPASDDHISQEIGDIIIDGIKVGTNIKDLMDKIQTLVEKEEQGLDKESEQLLSIKHILDDNKSLSLQEKLHVLWEKIEEMKNNGNQIKDELSETIDNIKMKLEEHKESSDGEGAIFNIVSHQEYIPDAFHETLRKIKEKIEAGADKANQIIDTGVEIIENIDNAKESAHERHEQIKEKINEVTEAFKEELEEKVDNIKAKLGEHKEKLEAIKEASQDMFPGSNGADLEDEHSEGAGEIDAGGVAEDEEEEEEEVTDEENDEGNANDVEIDVASPVKGGAEQFGKIQIKPNTKIGMKVHDFAENAKAVVEDIVGKADEHAENAKAVVEDIVAKADEHAEDAKAVVEDIVGKANEHAENAKAVVEDIVGKADEHAGNAKAVVEDIVGKANEHAENSKAVVEDMLAKANEHAENAMAVVEDMFAKVDKHAEDAKAVIEDMFANAEEQAKAIKDVIEAIAKENDDMIKEKQSAAVGEEVASVQAYSDPEAKFLASDPFEKLKAMHPSLFIIGGTDAEKGEFPWQCSLQIKIYPQTSSHHCGCAILSNRWVLTAAHCVHEIEANLFTVVVGLHKFSETTGTVSHNIEEIITHEGWGTQEYGMGLFPYDIALLAIATEIQMTTDVGTVDLAPADLEATDCKITGWGVMTDGAVTGTLQVADTSVLSKQECKEKWNPSYIGPGHVCVYYNAMTGACVGDSGGPLVCRDEKLEGSDYVLVGLTSWGNTWCSPYSPSIYTSVSFNEQWITDIVASRYADPDQIS